MRNHKQVTVSCAFECPPHFEAPYFIASTDSEQENFQIVKCRNCELIYLNPRPSIESLLSYYSEGYYGFGVAKFDQVTENAVATFVKWRAFLLNRYIKPNSSVLDVGCGRGNFLEAMEKCGHTVYGTELTEDSAQRAKKKFGEKVYVGELLSLNLESESFDMITLWHVIEHVGDPVGYLREIYRLLKPNGVVVLAQPNIESIQAKIGGPVWFHLDVPRHLYHFSPKTITRLFASAKLRLVSMSHYSVEQNPFGLLQSCMNRMGVPQNYLYRVIKNEGFQLNWVASKALLTLYYLLMPVAIVLTAIESAIGRGGTFYMVGRKNP